MTGAPSPAAARSPLARALWLAAAALAFAGFVALGTWQVERRAWKLALIERVQQRLQAEPAAPPPRPQWPAIDATHDEYRRLRLAGRYLAGADTLVQAVTDRGAGFWLLTPLRLDDGTLVLVNRGFVPPGWREAAAPADPVALTGLLRITEPGGGFLRRNDAAANRWYSRDVQAIAAARGLVSVAPYFVDAEAGPGTAPDGRFPVAGLTVIAFRNSHLVYAITWYTLAAMTAGGAAFLLRAGRAPAA